MKIVFVIESLNCGGAEKSLITLLSLLNYSQYTVDLLLFRRGGMFEEMVPKEVNILDGMKYARFTWISWGALIVESLHTLKFNKLFARLTYLAKRRLSFTKKHNAQRYWESMGHLIDECPSTYDVAVAYNQGFATYFVAEKMSAKKKLAVVNIDYGAAGYDRRHDFRHYEQFEKILTDGEQCKKILQDTYPEFSSRVEIIHDINAPDMIRRMADGAGSFTDDYDGIRLLTISRLSLQKGYDIAMDACQKLKQKGLKFRWYVIGDGPLRRMIEESIKKLDIADAFILLGEKSNPYPYLKDCKIYVQTSKFEGFPIILVEARLLNKPIVTTNFTSASEQITHGKNGIVADMNGEAVCDGILALAGNESLMNDMVTCLKKEKKGNVEEVDAWNKLISAGV